MMFFSCMVVSLTATLVWTGLHASLNLLQAPTEDGGVLERLGALEGNMWWLGPFQPPKTRNLYEACPAPKMGWESALPVVGPILASRRAAQHVACLQATRTNIEREYLLFTARCITWWTWGVVLVVLQRLLCMMMRKRMAHVPRPTPHPDDPDVPGPTQPNLIQYGTVTPQEVCTAMRCVWYCYTLLRLHRYLRRPHPKALPAPSLPSSIALPPAAALLRVTSYPSVLPILTYS